MAINSADGSTSRRSRFDSEFDRSDTTRNFQRGEAVVGDRANAVSAAGVGSTPRSRESIVRSYDSEGASRARGARMQSNSRYKGDIGGFSRGSQESGSSFSAVTPRPSALNQNDPFYRQASPSSRNTERGFRTERVAPPLSSDQSMRETRSFMERYERERAARDPRLKANALRRGNREVIDARGSVDSRAFNELNELVGYSIDEADKPNPLVDASNPKAKWRSHSADSPTLSSRGFSGSRRNGNLASLSDTISGKDSYGGIGRKSGIADSFFSLPTYIKIAIPVLVILTIVLLVILFF